MNWVDALEQREILERDDPYWYDICAFCGSYEGEPHCPDCTWVRIRLEHDRGIAA